MNREFFKGVLEAAHSETCRRLKRAVVRLIGVLLTVIGLIVVSVSYDGKVTGLVALFILGNALERE